MNYSLKFQLVKKGISQKTISDYLGISARAFSMKLSGKSSFKVGEARDISRFLNLTPQQSHDIFFQTELHENENDFTKGE